MRRQALEILAMHDDIDVSGRPACAHQCAPTASFLRMRAGDSRDPVAVGGLGILEADLDMFETGLRPAADAASSSSTPEVMRFV